MEKPEENGGLPNTISNVAENLSAISGGRIYPLVNVNTQPEEDQRTSFRMGHCQ